jgi:thiol-disulfide isomerase/thioredoxin
VHRQGNQPQRLRGLDRLRHLTAAAALLALVACDEPAKRDPGAAPQRFAAVKKEGASQAARRFCEVTFPASGEGSRRWQAPAERPLPAPGPKAPAPAKGWTWVNLWATWCGPCMEELPLLGRWMDALGKEGVPVRLELWSLDDDGDSLAKSLGARAFPGEVRWAAGGSEAGPLLEQLGIARDSAIPVHALVDPAGQLRCVRVGSVAEDAYGAVKAILAGG